MTTSISDILNQREKTHGTFSQNANTAQTLKSVVRGFVLTSSKLDADQREALDNICQKIARILSGGHDHADNWIDIAGYATLVSNRLEAEQVPF